MKRPKHVAADSWANLLEFFGGEKNLRAWIRCGLVVSVTDHRRRSRKPRCGAHARSTGKPCQRSPMLNGRCELHGGCSTGPRTPEGRKRLEDAVRQRWREWRKARGLPDDKV